MPIDHLPAPWQPPVRKFRDWVITDHGIMLILATVFLCRSVSYLGDHQALIQHVFELQSRWLSPAIWVTGALVLIAALLLPGGKLDTFALSLAVAILMLWGVLYLWSPAEVVHMPIWWPEWLGWFERLLGHLIPFLSRGIVYMAVAGMTVYTVWRGRSATVYVREVPDDARSGRVRD